MLMCKIKKESQSSASNSERVSLGQMFRVTLLPLSEKVAHKLGTGMPTWCWAVVSIAVLSLSAVCPHAIKLTSCWSSVVLISTSVIERWRGSFCRRSLYPWATAVVSRWVYGTWRCLLSLNCNGPRWHSTCSAQSDKKYIWKTQQQRCFHLG